MSILVHMERRTKKINGKCKYKRNGYSLDLVGERFGRLVVTARAEDKTGIGRSHISQCCNGKRKSTGGYIWRFKDE